MWKIAWTKLEKVYNCYAKTFPEKVCLCQIFVDVEYLKFETPLRVKLILYYSTRSNVTNTFINMQLSLGFWYSSITILYMFPGNITAYCFTSNVAASYYRYTLHVCYWLSYIIFEIHLIFINDVQFNYIFMCIMWPAVSGWHD